MAKAGRKIIEIDFDQLEKLCALQCTLKEVANFFECSEDTIMRRVREETGLDFATFFSQKSEKGRVSLRRKMWEMALKGDRVMLIWISKQHLGFSEKVDQKVEATTVNQNLCEPITSEHAKLLVEKINKQREDAENATKKG